MKRKIMLVDGYNMIAFWQETKQLFKTNQLDQARTILLNKLNNYAHFEKIEIVCVFDAQFVPGVRQRYDQYMISVVFTEEDETADSYIDRLDNLSYQTKQSFSPGQRQGYNQWC